MWSFTPRFRSAIDERRRRNPTSLRSRATPQNLLVPSGAASVRCALRADVPVRCERALRADELQCRRRGAQISRTNGRRRLHRLRLPPIAPLALHLPLRLGGGADRDAAGAGARHLLRARGGGASCAPTRSARACCGCSAASPPSPACRRTCCALRVLADQEVARPFYGAMRILVLSTLAVARRAVADGVAAPGLSASAAASAAVFGGGALLALVFQRRRARHRRLGRRGRAAAGASWRRPGGRGC